MSEVDQILEEAERLGLKLTVKGDRIAIRPDKLCTPAMLERIRQNKAAVHGRLRALVRKPPGTSPGSEAAAAIIPAVEQHAPTRVAFLPKDEEAWLPIARQILSKEFRLKDQSTMESFLIGLRGIKHPECERAVKKLRRFTVKT